MREKHGMTGTRFNNIFRGIKARCNIKSHPSYKNYGGAGIKCLWNSFDEFKNDMYESYLEHVEKFGENNTTIDRIDYNGNYCKENCRRATMKEQGNNTSTNVHIRYKGKEYKSIMLLCEELGLNRTSISYRLSIGMSINDAIEKEFRTYNKYNGQPL